MKVRVLILALFVSVLGVQVRAAADQPKAEQAQPAEGKEHKKNTTVIVLTATPEKVHAAVLEALASVGATVKKDTPTEIESKRSNKVGFVVGSGGEKILVSIKDLGQGKTELKVVTKKTVLGIAGQKLWNDEVANKVRDALK